MTRDSYTADLDLIRRWIRRSVPSRLQPLALKAVDQLSQDLTPCLVKPSPMGIALLGKGASA